jgi:hypothetical protein
MVEADEHHPVDGVRRHNKARNPIDGEVGPFRLLDLDEEPHLLAVRPVKHFDKCRDPCPGKALMKPGSRIETADPCTVFGMLLLVANPTKTRFLTNDTLGGGGEDSA